MMQLSLALGAALLFSTPAVSETILVHAGTLLAVPGSDPVTERTLVIRDGKIAEIRDGFDPVFEEGHYAVFRINPPR